MPKLSNLEIQKIHARELLDSRGFPTIEVELTLQDAHYVGEVVVGRALVPSGASTGEGEALELRDGDAKRFLGKGVQKAVHHVNRDILSRVMKQKFDTFADFDQALIQLDGTPTKSKLGANAILGASLAYVRAASLSLRKPTHELIAQTFGSAGVTLPVPLMNVINGGKHADNTLAIQEFMIVPHGFQKFSDALRAGTEVFHSLKKLLHSLKLSTNVGDEGGFAPIIPGEHPHEGALKLLLKAITEAGYKPGEQIGLALDAAASEFSTKNGTDYTYNFEGKSLTSAQMVDVYAQWCTQYPIVSIEDGLAEHDWAGWAQLTQALGRKIQLVGDDLFVTNVSFLKKGIQQKVANSILIKVNQIGTFTETLEAMKLAKTAQYTQIASHRSGETEDVFIADLAVGTDCGQIKTGSASRTDRIAKYNQLLRIEESLKHSAKFAGTGAFRISL